MANKWELEVDKSRCKKCAKENGSFLKQWIPNM